MAITMHCRKKRKSRSDGADSQYVAEKDEDCSECRINVGFENRTDDEGPSIVISDSDDEVMENGSILPKKRLRTPLHRKTLAVKRKIAHMTEEEQLALALKISQREQTNHVKYRPEEDELLKEDIQALFTKGLPGECAGVTPVALGESAVSPTVVRSRRRLIEHTEDVLDEEITICPETQPSPARQEDSDREDGTDFTEPTPVPQTCVSDGSPVEDVICLEQTCPKNVECPMCGCTFSRSQIERHAAYCDGTNSQQEMAVLRPRHKLMRRNHTGSDVSILAADSGKYEKCYLCKSLVPLTDYQAHVDNCLHTAELETEGSRRIRSNKQASAGRDGRLLSMLEQSESLSEGPNSIARDSPYVSPPREENNGNVSSEHLNFTDSPIRSFVSISEARDCLVDFKKQYSRQPNCKGASRRGKRHKM
ncbi:BRCA1-A complex subunit RAP80 isoform X6 [Pseudophryne corroboree]|uniref:BRCA1-A complex subunit RAP80 isoform X6 n=1 Tax=Pseudophryne corroboree TaxID=495146 RepID=UPI0030818C04